MTFLKVVEFALQTSLAPSTGHLGVLVSLGDLVVFPLLDGRTQIHTLMFNPHVPTCAACACFIFFF